MYKYYYEFGAITHEKLKLNNVEEQILLTEINQILILKKVNYYLIIILAIYIFLLSYHSLNFNNPYFFVNVFFYLLGIYLVYRVKYIYFIEIIYQNSKSVLITKYFFKEKKAIRFKNKINNKIIQFKEIKEIDILINGRNPFFNL
jgi:hypothetical protein